MTLISIKHLNHFFKDKQVLKDINLEIKSGEIFGLLGPSGAGKTTLINICTSQIKDYQGEVRVLGYQANNIPNDAFKDIGIVLDETGLYERFTCFQNLKIITDLYGIDSHKINEVLNMVGLQNDSHKVVSKLSKGMKQRLTIARAILNNPKILFLDEPTSGLDPATSAKIHNIIQSFKNQGCMVFLTTHKMDEASKLCDRIGLINDGYLIANDSLDNLLAKYHDDKKLHIKLTSGEVVVVDADIKGAEVITNLIMQKRLSTIHSNEPNLETIFLRLTNRELNDEDMDNL